MALVDGPRYNANLMVRFRAEYLAINMLFHCVRACMRACVCVCVLRLSRLRGCRLVYCLSFTYKLSKLTKSLFFAFVATRTSFA